MTFAEEIYEQPDTLRRVADHIAPTLAASLKPWAQSLSDGTLRRVIFTGMGGSFYAAAPAVLMLNEHGIEAQSIESSELLYYGQVRADTLLVAVSQSGESVEVVKLLDKLGESVPVLGITNDAKSSLGTRSRVALDIQAGPELTVSTKTYTGTVAALDLVARALLGQDIAPAADRLRKIAQYVADMLPHWEKSAVELTEAFADTQFIVFLGRGPSRASAMTSALITKESCKLPTEGMVSGMFRHGPLEVAGKNVATMIFAPNGRTSSLNLDLAEYMTQLPGPVCVVGDEEPAGPIKMVPVSFPEALDEWTAPIVEIIPIQLMLGKLSARRGYDTGKFLRGTKITVQE